eukprot:scaffold179261_cov23-Tisochrysis_lutea.AAC.1
MPRGGADDLELDDLPIKPAPPAETLWRRAWPRLLPVEARDAPMNPLCRWSEATRHAVDYRSWWWKGLRTIEIIPPRCAPSPTRHCGCAGGEITSAARGAWWARGGVNEEQIFTISPLRDRGSEAPGADIWTEIAGSPIPAPRPRLPIPLISSSLIP